MRFILRPGLLFTLAAGTLSLFGCAAGLPAPDLETELPHPASAPFSRLYPLCNAYSQTRHYDKLFSCLDHLQQRVEAGDFKLQDSNLSAAPALLRSRALMETGDYLHALEAAKYAEPSFRASDTPIEILQSGLGQSALIHALTGHRDEASALLQELATLPAKNPGSDFEMQQALEIARVRAALGEFSQTVKLLQEPQPDPDYYQELTESARTSDPSWTRKNLPREFLRHHALLETGDHSTARAGFDALLQMKDTPETHRLYWMSLYNRGRIAEAADQPESALGLYRRALEIIERLRSPVHSETGKTGLVGDPQDVYRRTLALYVSMGDAEAAFQTAERAKGRLLVEALSEKNDFTALQTHPPGTDTLLSNLIQAEQQATFQTGDPEGDRLIARVQTLRKSLREVSPRQADLFMPQPVPANEIQARLDPRESLIEYFHHENHLYAFVLGRTILHMQKLDATGLDAEVEAFQTALRSPKSTDYLNLAQRLYKRLVQPLEAHLQKPLITLVPHGILHAIPFNTLYSGERFFIDNHALRLLPSARLLFQETVAGPFDIPGLLAVGNPGEDLKFTEQEIQIVAQQTPAALVLSHHEATEKHFKEAVGGFGTVHVATRGRIQGKAPLKSGFQMGSDANNDGILTLSEIFDLNLAARLVTLTNCEMEGTLLEVGRSVPLLAQSWLHAGAWALVSGLWRVDDAASVELMQTFYEYLHAAPVGPALQQAQLKLRTQYPHPYYWGAFQLTGQITLPPVRNASTLLQQPALRVKSPRPEYRAVPSVAPSAFPKAFSG